MTRRTVSEVKNVSEQYYTKQIRDYVHFARRNGGRTFYLYVRRSTHLSEPLKEAIGRKDVRVRYIWG